MTPDLFYSNVQNMIDDIILKLSLPKNSLYLYQNISKKGKNMGKETSKSICIFEPEYPPRKRSKEENGKNFVVLKISIDDKKEVSLYIRKSQYAKINIPGSENIKTSKVDSVFQRVIFGIEDDMIYDYIRENVLYCLANYESSNKFGCCSKFIECSDARECVHENKIYSMGCMYRKNLDAGRIFYGKNKNVP